MKNTFYIMKRSESTYQLRVLSNHQVYSTSSSLDTLLDNVRTIVKRYKTPLNISKYYTNTDYGIRRVSKDEVRMCENYINNEGKAYEDILNDTIDEVLKELQPKRIALGKESLKKKPEEKEPLDAEEVVPKKVKKIRPLKKIKIDIGDQ